MRRNFKRPRVIFVIFDTNEPTGFSSKKKKVKLKKVKIKSKRIVTSSEEKSETETLQSIKCSF